MSEFLRGGFETFEDDREHDADVDELAISGLSRVIKERGSIVKDDEDETGGDEYESDDDGWDGDFEGESDYDEGEDEDEDEDEDERSYYSEEEERRYGEERVDFNEERIRLTEIPIPKELMERYAFLSELPHGVAVMGGVARSVAREIITGEREPIRDIDLVNIVDEAGNSEVDEPMLDELSRKYMPDDYAFGHGIKNDTLENYFKSRDFTINQSLIMDGKLIVSDLAYDDFEENIIRPTYFEHPYAGDEVSSRLFLKALMMRDVVSQISDFIPLIEDMEPPEDVWYFDVALFLNKAMSRGAVTARIFTEDLAEWGAVPKDYSGRPMALAKMLNEQLYGFEFRPSTDGRFVDVEECEDMNGFFVPVAMSEYHASDPTVRRAIAEYEGSDEVINIWEERPSGYYTQAEYAEMNRAG